MTFAAELTIDSSPTASDPAIADGRSAIGKASNAARPFRLPWLALTAAGVFVATAGYTAVATGPRDWPGTSVLAGLEAAAAGVLVILSLAAIRFRKLRTRLTHAGRWLVVLPLFLAIWEALTAKLAILPLPWFPPLASVVQVFVDDYETLFRSTLYSSRLLLLGAAIGAFSGFVTGVAVAWSNAIGYWINPVLKVIGPVPATAWLPIIFVVFPTSFSASIFLVALSAWFPVTVLTSSGVASVKASYYDVARTLGASPWFLVRKVAVPAALPHVFVGLFMGLGSTFVTLIVAEMLGVKAGLGWYIQWAIGWAAYNKMYAGLIVMALLFSGLLSVVFAIRDHFLSWQKGLLRW
jgi:NitT/TauT family transport system permease protein